MPREQRRSSAFSFLPLSLTRGQNRIGAVPTRSRLCQRFCPPYGRGLINEFWSFPGLLDSPNSRRRINSAEIHSDLISIDMRSEWISAELIRRRLLGESSNPGNDQNSLIRQRP